MDNDDIKNQPQSLKATAATTQPARAPQSRSHSHRATGPHRHMDKSGDGFSINGARGYLPASKLKVDIELAKPCLE